MGSPVRMAILAAMAGCLCGYTATAQSAQSQQNQQSQPTQNQDSNTGVSHPPADDTIQADEDTAAPAPAPAPKPSPAIRAATPASPSPAAIRGGDADEDIAGGSRTDKDVTLRTRPEDDSEYGIVSYVPDDPNALAEGTNLRVELTQDLSTADTERGATFEAKLTGNVYKDGHVAIPAGSVLRGEVVHVSQGHHLGPHAALRLRPDVVVLPDGKEYHLMAEVVESDVSGTKVNEEGTIEASIRYKKDTAEYGAGAGAGAAAGALIAGPVGAGVGSLVGAGAVSAHMLTSRPEAANLPQGSVLIFSLTEPMQLTASKN
jgi:hypothetical protein